MSVRDNAAWPPMLTKINDVENKHENMDEQQKEIMNTQQ